MKIYQWGVSKPAKGDKGWIFWGHSAKVLFEWEKAPFILKEMHDIMVNLHFRN